MFLNNKLESIDGVVDIATVSTRLCAQAEYLRSSLRESQDLNADIEIAEKYVGNDCIIALLAMVQCVDRDVNNDFRPIESNQSTALTSMADVALLTLTDLYNIGESLLKSGGWQPIDQSSTISGGIVYEHSESGETSEEPEYEKWSWQIKLILSIPILIEPGCVDDEAVWAAAVVYYHHNSSTDTERREYDLEYLEQQLDRGSNCLSVVDVLKSDEDRCQSAVRLRGTYRGCWRGLYAEPLEEMDMKNNSIGQNLESWTATTVAGLTSSSSLSNSSRVLVIGLGCGQLVSFLQRYITNVELQVVESSQLMVDIATNYYQLDSILDYVSVVDPTEYVKSQCVESQEVGGFDTIIVNVCGNEDTFPTSLNGDFFHGLISMLSNHPTATLLVNTGVSVDSVSSLIGNTNMLILKEYLLRDHTESDNEGMIVAVRRCDWSLSVESWNREHLGDDAQSSGAMDVDKAQQTAVVRLEKFLSIKDIEMINSVAKAELSRGNTALEKHSESWKVVYLQANNIFHKKLPTIRQKILDTIRQVDKSNWCLFDNVDNVSIRVVEYHTNQTNHSLSDPKHYDLNSLLTCDIMLSNDGLFEGGHLQTLEADGTLKKHEFKQGDALIFVSHKYHNVSRVISGSRNVMVLEFWQGAERQCSHRCERFGRQICDKDPQDSYTQQYHSRKQTNQKEHSGASLPFRLGSVSTCKEDSPLQLLWEPTEVVNKPVQANEEKSKDMNDAFACFGDSSDSDDDD